MNSQLEVGGLGADPRATKTGNIPRKQRADIELPRRKRERERERGREIKDLTPQHTIKLSRRRNRRDGGSASAGPCGFSRCLLARCVCEHAAGRISRGNRDSRRAGVPQRRRRQSSCQRRAVAGGQELQHPAASST